MLVKKIPNLPSLESLKSLAEFNDYFNTYNNKQDLLKKLDYLSKYLLKISLRSNLENQSFNSLSSRYKNKKYIDNEFPPSLISLIGYHNTTEPKWSKIIWQRPDDYMTNYTVFPPEYSKLKIYRGVLNNSTFLSVISSLVENPEIIKSLFLTKDIMESGMYCIYLCKDGKYKEYIIDDYFPCDNKKLTDCFSHGEKNTIWLQILEKCYAKAYGSYCNIENNDLERIVRDIVKAPLISLDNSCEQLYLNLENAQKNNYLIFAGAGDSQSGKELIKEIGLLPEYAYSISNIYIINDEIVKLDESINTNTNSEQKIDDINSNILLKIRNFWRKDEWLGDWSNGSMNWTEEIKNKIGYDKNETNCFYMNLKDFKHYFSKIVISHYKSNYEYKYISIIQKSDTYSLVKMTINTSDNKKAHCFINFLQAINNKKPSVEKYGIIRMVVCKILKYNEKTNDYEIDYIDGKMTQDRDSFIEKIYEPGEYLIYTELNIINTEIVVSTYSDSKIELEKVENKNFDKILEKICISLAKKNQSKVYCYENEGAPNCFKYSDFCQIGYSYIYIENNEKDATLIENVNYTKFDGVKLVEPFSGTSYKLKVGPGENQLVLIKQLNLSGCNLTLTYNNYFLFGEEALKNLTIKKGKHKKRKNPRINVELEINVYSYQHSGGLCFYYENNETNYSLEETLKFNAMNGLEIEGEHDLKDEVSFVVGPKENKFIQLKATQPNWTIQSKVSYLIRQV